jgi:hypothetical protein
LQLINEDRAQQAVIPIAQYHRCIMLNTLTMLSVFLTDAQQSISVAKLPPVSVTRDGLDWLLVIFSGLLAIVGFIGIFVAWRTVSATKKAAEAALKQADHMVASERAWLVISSVAKNGSVVQPGFAPYYWWQVKNLGSTPARLIDTQAHCKVDTGHLPEPMPEEPTFDKRAIELHERILGPGDTLDFFSLWEKEDGTTFRDRMESLDQICLRAYGYIRYKTMFGPEICESRFCDYFNHFPDKPIATNQMLYLIDFRPDLTAPAAYTKST